MIVEIGPIFLKFYEVNYEPLQAIDDKNDKHIVWYFIDTHAEVSILSPQVVGDVVHPFQSTSNTW